MGGAAECTARWDGGEWSYSIRIGKRIKFQKSELILSCLYVSKGCQSLHTYPDMRFVQNFAPPDVQAKLLHHLSPSPYFNSFSDKNAKKNE